jgi:hypothetical protein
MKRALPTVRNTFRARGSYPCRVSPMGPGGVVKILRTAGGPCAYPFWAQNKGQRGPKVGPNSAPKRSDSAAFGLIGRPTGAPAQHGLPDSCLCQ